MSDYLPETVRAWKAQRDDERDPNELARALTQILRVAGSETSSRDSVLRAGNPATLSGGPDRKECR
ncbi:hypothetical protein ACFSC4_19495 [Deinococcus malanensis]|uniref:hypothetical protein n=1 Tax=Deinococcus malanensis TaxID=1706855 RepID=UPI003633E742